MKTVWMTALAAAVAAPAAAQHTGPAVVEVIGHGAVEVRAIGQRFSVTYAGTGATKAAAEADRARKEAAVLRMLAADGVPATAITPLAQNVASMLSMYTLATATDDAPDAAPTERAVGGQTVTAATLSQVARLTTSLRAAGATVDDPTPIFGQPDEARRTAKLQALTDARAVAERYASALRMHVGPVRRVSETGNNVVLPGLQEKMRSMMDVGTTRAALVAALGSNPTETMKVEEAIVVEYALLP